MLVTEVSVVNRSLKKEVSEADVIVKPDHVNVADVAPLGTVADAHSLASKIPLPLKSIKPINLAVTPVVFVTEITGVV